MTSMARTPSSGGTQTGRLSYMPRAENFELGTTNPTLTALTRMVSLSAPTAPLSTVRGAYWFSLACPASIGTWPWSVSVTSTTLHKSMAKSVQTATWKDTAPNSVGNLCIMAARSGTYQTRNGRSSRERKSTPPSATAPLWATGDIPAANVPDSTRSKIAKHMRKPPQALDARPTYMPYQKSIFLAAQEMTTRSTRPFRSRMAASARPQLQRTTRNPQRSS